MFLGLLEQRPERLADVGEAQLIGLTESLPISPELFLLEMKIRLERLSRVCRNGDIPNSRGWFAAEK